MKISRFHKWFGASVIVTALTVGGGIVLAQNAKEGRPCYRNDQCASQTCGCTGAATWQAEDGTCLQCPPGSTKANENGKVKCVTDADATKTVQVKIVAGTCTGGAKEVGGGDVDNQELNVRADVPVDQMRSKSEEHLADMRKVLERVVEVQGIARKQQDVLKLNCVNDKLLQIKQFLNIAEKAFTDMVEAIAGNDTGGAYDRLSDITIAWEEVTRLGAEAEQCIGTDLSYLGPSDTTVEGGEDLDDVDTQEPDFPEVDPLPLSSPDE
jgi:hypothetical protein